MKKRIKDVLPNNEVENLDNILRTMLRNTGNCCQYDKSIRKGLIKALRILEEWAEIEIEIEVKE